MFAQRLLSDVGFIALNPFRLRLFLLLLIALAILVAVAIPTGMTFAGCATSNCPCPGC